ncbi:MAG: TolC family protein [Leptospiraceae bacterium]|nr:TolC family protein [Leptospiraceae bacterium]
MYFLKRQVFQNVFFFTGLFLTCIFPTAIRSENSCESFSSIAEILACVQEHHPAVQIARADVQAGNADIETAGQWPNPELEGELNSGPSGEITYLHTFEPGDRRDLRTTAARRMRRRSEARLALARQDAVLETLHTLFLWQQNKAIGERLAAIESTYNQALYRLHRLPVLTPEKRTYILTLRLAMKTIQQQKVLLMDERQTLSNRMAYFLNRTEAPNLDVTDRLLATGLPDYSAENPIRSAELEEEAANAAGYEALYRLEQSRVWPDLQIGPRVGFSTESSPGPLGIGSSTGQEFEAGLAFRIRIPLYNQNDGAIEAARQRARGARLRQSITEDRLLNEQRRLADSYGNYRRLLREAVTPAQLENERRLLTNYLQRGVLSPLQLIEYHRTQLEYLRQYFELRRAATLTLWKLYSLDGTLLQPEFLNSFDADQEAQQ